MQLAIHRTDQCKLFPLIVLLQYARVSYTSHCAILGCFAQIRTFSVVQPAGHVLRNSGLRQAISELAQRSGKALLHGFEPRLESLTPRLGLVGCPRSVSVVLSWCSANPPILDEWSAIWKLEGSLVDF
jgi:hypothetical protein